MLSVSGKEYCIPMKTCDEWDEVCWRLYRRPTHSAIASEYVVAKSFNFTLWLKLDTPGNTYEITVRDCRVLRPYTLERATFIYDGESVKPTGRTLRIFGSERLEPVVKWLAFNRELDPKPLKGVTFWSHDPVKVN